MTTKNIKGPSIAGDPYYTPKWLVDLCIKHILPNICENPKSILEPGAGRGVFVKGLRRAYPDSYIYALDIDKNVGPWEEANSSEYVDYLSDEFWENFGAGSCGLIVGNPPYSLAMEFIKRSLAMAGNLVFLLRQGFLSSGKRNVFFMNEATRPTSVWIIPDRPKFRDDMKHGDSADYAFVCWTGETKQTELYWLPSLPKEDRRE